MLGSEFGQFEYEDLKGSKYCNKVNIIAKKNYFLIRDDIVVKKGFKGIHVDNDKWISKEENDHIKDFTK